MSEKERKIMAGKILVAVFSASGVTKRVGEEIARIAGADFYEIVPKEIYTSADLDWMNKKSRSSIEMNDPSARPEINGKVADMASYDTVIVGFPIWWGVAPRIIDTFLESYEFSGKNIIPFCTSGGSGVGRSDTALHKDVSGDVKRMRRRSAAGLTKFCKKTKREESRNEIYRKETKYDALRGVILCLLPKSCFFIIVNSKYR